VRGVESLPAHLNVVYTHVGELATESDKMLVQPDRPNCSLHGGNAMQALYATRDVHWRVGNAMHALYATCDVHWRLVLANSCVVEIYLSL
jgi:hypothetical protein